MSRSRRTTMAHLVSFSSGLLFAIGLATAGMTRPDKVLGFLDVTGAWDPSLAFVMAGAVAVYAAAYQLVRRRAAPLAGEHFHLPTRRDLEPKLLAGAGLFGVGWGLAGYCPGPAITSLGTGGFEAFLFVAAMAFGMVLFDLLRRVRNRPMPANKTRALDTSVRRSV